MLFAFPCLVLRVSPGGVLTPHGPESLPHSRVALEAAPKGDLPDPVSVVDLALVLAPSELVPNGGGGGAANITNFTLQGLCLENGK